MRLTLRSAARSGLVVATVLLASAFLVVPALAYDYEGDDLDDPLYPPSSKLIPEPPHAIRAAFEPDNSPSLPRPPDDRFEIVDPRAGETPLAAGSAGLPRLSGGSYLFLNLKTGSAPLPVDTDAQRDIKQLIRKLG